MSSDGFELLRRFAALNRELAAFDPDGLDEGEYLAWIAELEVQRRRAQALDHQIVSEVEFRDFSTLRLARDSAGVLAQVWRISIREARARVGEAELLGERVALTGEVLEPERPLIAAARRRGEVGAEQVQVMTGALTKLPATLPVEEAAGYEQILVDAARSLGPRDLAKVAERLVATVNPDGTLLDDEEQQRRRHLTLSCERDGMVQVRGVLDAETGARALAVLGGLSKPRPDDAGGPDERTAGQRTHDAFADLLSLAQRAGELNLAGKPATMLQVTMTADQFESGTGVAYTSYGQPIRVEQALRLADQASIGWLVHNSAGGVLNYGRAERLATESQVRALIARDQGCCFPGCSIPPEWTERHHVQEWQAGGSTDIDNLVLLCKYHHSRHVRGGWRIHMRDGIPWFVPPPFIDPDQRPVPPLHLAIAAMATAVVAG